MEGGLKHQQTNKHAFAQATEISSHVWYLDISKQFTADKMTFITARCCSTGQPWSSEVETPTCCLRRVDSDAIYTNNNHKDHQQCEYIHKTIKLKDNQLIRQMGKSTEKPWRTETLNNHNSNHLIYNNCLVLWEVSYLFVLFSICSIITLTSLRLYKYTQRLVLNVLWKI